MKPDQRSDLERLTAQLRAQGIQPRRDLWPGISAAIDGVEKVGGPAPAPRREPWPRRQLAAAVAALLLLAAGGSQYQRELFRLGALPAQTAAVSELAVLDQARDELNQALAERPADAGLTRLLQMVEQSRADLLRLNARGWQREIPAGPLS